MATSCSEPKALTMGRRWDGDERGEGVGDAAPFAPAADRFGEMMRRPNWVAEEPGLHLLPHLLRACESLPFHLLNARVAEDASFEVELEWAGDSHSVGEIRAAAFALIGSFAEPWTYVRQQPHEERDGAGELLTFDVVTGILDDQDRFEPHGHTLKVSVVERGRAAPPG
jgi:hypothetical protein